MAPTLLEKLNALLESSSAKNAEAIKRLLAQGVESFEDLEGLVSHDDEDLAVIAIWALGHVGGKRHAPGLLKVLESERSGAWMQTAVSLSQLSSKRTLRPLIDMLEDASPERRTAAVYALGFTDFIEKEVRDEVSAKLGDLLADTQQPESLRALAAEGLGNLHEQGDKRTRVFKTAASVLLHALHGKSAEVRFWAAFALGKMRVKSSLDGLKKLARNDDTVIPGWWSIAEEARDAITLIEGGQPAARVPRR